MKLTDAPLYDFIFDTSTFLASVAEENPDDVLGAPLAGLLQSVLSDWENGREDQSSRTIERAYNFCVIYRSAVAEARDSDESADSI